MLTVVLEGAFVLSRALDEPKAVARQLAHYRRYLELLFDQQEGGLRTAGGAAPGAR